MSLQKAQNPEVRKEKELSVLMDLGPGKCFHSVQNEKISRLMLAGCPELGNLCQARKDFSQEIQNLK